MTWVSQRSRYSRLGQLGERPGGVDFGVEEFELDELRHAGQGSDVGYVGAGERQGPHLGQARERREVAGSGVFQIEGFEVRQAGQRREVAAPVRCGPSAW